jgi:hypothetical protein
MSGVPSIERSLGQGDRARRAHHLLRVRRSPKPRTVITSRIQDNGSPTDLSTEPQTLIVNHFVLTGTAAIYGIVTSKVTAVTLQLASEIKELPIAGGAYLAVQQEADLRGAEVEVAAPWVMPPGRISGRGGA